MIGKAGFGRFTYVVMLEDRQKLHSHRDSILLGLLLGANTMGGWRTDISKGPMTKSRRCCLAEQNRTSTSAYKKDSTHHLKLLNQSYYSNCLILGEGNVSALLPIFLKDSTATNYSLMVVESSTLALPTGPYEDRSYLPHHPQFSHVLVPDHRGLERV